MLGIGRGAGRVGALVAAAMKRSYLTYGNT